MKIDELNQQAVASYVASVRNEKQPETSESQGATAGKQQSGTDKVELSSYIPVARRSRELRDTQATRVDELKAQIASGSYKIPGLAVAEKMVSKMMMSAARTTPSDTVSPTVQ